ncbi:hypothetical protein Tco_1414127 [Tanacetum coccineum]
MSTPTFSDTHNMVAFLEKPAKSDGFHEIIDFLNANQIHYALTVNPTIYTPCIEQFWATAKAKMVNGERQLQALVDKKKVIIIETRIRRDLHLEDAGGTDCLPTATIFEELARMGVTSSKDKESLGAQEDASKQGRIFEDFDKECEVSLIDETQGRLDDAEMFDTNDLHGDEVIVDMAVGEKQEQSAKVDEREVNTGVEDSVVPAILVTTVGKGVTTAIDELTLAQTLIEIKAAKPKAVTTATTTTTTTRPKARGVVVQEPIEFRTTTSSPQASQPSKAKEKGKAIMIEPEVPLKKKD